MSFFILPETAFFFFRSEKENMPLLNILKTPLTHSWFWAAFWLLPWEEKGILDYQDFCDNPTLMLRLAHKYIRPHTPAWEEQDTEKQVELNKQEKTTEAKWPFNPSVCASVCIGMYVQRGDALVCSTTGSPKHPYTLLLHRWRSASTRRKYQRLFQAFKPSRYRQNCK